jgi:hypothetical protein
MQIALTGNIDTSGLERVIPELVAFGRRTMQEQCVTSMGMILQDAQTNTKKVDVGRIADELEVTVTPQLSTRGKRAGLPLKSGKMTVAVPNMSYAMMIAIARLHPDSRYSQLTGNRWPVAMPDTEGQEEFLDYMANVAARMVSRRRSSTHFLQFGYKEARDECVSSPLFKNRYRAQMRNSNQNPLNTMSAKELGGTVIELVGDSCVVTSMNNIGEGGNDVLDQKHREALIRESRPKLEQAVQNETVACEVELARRFELGWKQNPASLLL